LSIKLFLRVSDFQDSYRQRMRRGNAFGRVRECDNVCLSVCVSLSDSITFENFDQKPRSSIKVIRSRSTSEQKTKRDQTSLLKYTQSCTIVPHVHNENKVR